MLPPAFPDISIEDMLDVVRSGTTERKQLEFKRELDPKNSGHKEKFLAEVTSFANTSGGDLLIGVQDPDDVETGEDGDLFWTTDYDRDQYKLDWENIIRGNTQPRLDCHEIRTLPNPEGQGFVTIIRVRQSTISPHRVTLKSKKPFYARNSAGKYPLDVEQLREKFIEQHRLREEIEQSLADRIAKIRSGNTPAPFEPGPCMVLHMIPVTAFSLQPGIDLSVAESQIDELPLFKSNRGNIHSSARRNVDGIVNSQDIGQFRQGSDNDPRSEYVQIFRDGRIEAVHSFNFRNNTSEEPKIGFWTLYEILNDRLPDYASFLYDCDVRLPVFVYLTFIDAKGFAISIDKRNTSKELDRNVASLPVVRFDSYSVSSETVAREFLQHIWHAFGELGDPFDYFDMN